MSNRRDFKTWLSTFRKSIANYSYYVVFESVYKNVETIRTDLFILSSLIGSQNIENDFESLINRYPNVLKCIPILLAKRELEIPCMDSNGSFTYNFEKQNYSIDQYKYFMQKTGLFELLSKRLVNNLVDYVFGVEAGLNSNSRKNRGGQLMENIVESFIKQAGFIENQDYFKQMNLEEIEKRTSLNLSSISNNGSTIKRFDFVIFTKNTTYAIETNFYSSGGSKLNETARSYKMIALEARNINNFKFVWITDGKGWEFAKNNLKETFDVLEDIYNIQDLEKGLFKKI